MELTAEQMRLRATQVGRALWKYWGPYLSERQWGTVREDYSPNGDAWSYLPHDMARSRAYRWGEDGLAGISDHRCRLCLALALWNGRDPILKERLFGLTNGEGNHGEDVKELYYYLDATPTHSYLKMLYKYPQREFPYTQLIEENARRSRFESEFELLDTGLFDDDRYFDIFVEYAKASPSDILMRVQICNRGPDAATIHVLPQLWFRNTWSWKADESAKPAVSLAGQGAVEAVHPVVGRYRLYADESPPFLFTENETNFPRVFGFQETDVYFKDAFHKYVVGGKRETINPAQTGTKAAAHYVREVPARGAVEIRLRLSTESPAAPFADFAEVFKSRIRDADEFYAALQAGLSDADARLVQRQALAGMIWNKQFYYYDIPEWIDGDPAQPPPPLARRQGRNNDWRHLNNADLISMPDKWEYPWYAAWDLAFHCLPLALVDG